MSQNTNKDNISRLADGVAFIELNHRTDKLMDVISSGHATDKEIRGFIEELLREAYLAGRQDVLEEMQPAIDALESLRRIM